MSRRSLAVPEGLVGERVDAALARLLGVSRTTAAALVTEGKVRLDGETTSKSTRLEPGGWLDVDLGGPTDAAGQSTDPTSAGRPQVIDGLAIVHDDDDIVVVDKPVGVAAHPSPGWLGPTVVGGLEAAGFSVASSGAAERQGIVHRLDVGTSGLMVVAKSERAYSALKQAFRDREVEKVYHAVVQGHPDPTKATIDAPIGRHPRDDWRWAVVSEGKPSITHYELVEAYRAASRLEVHLETGRTHQIRVHFAALRHPLVGDLTYGADPTLASRLGLERQWLHALRLAFTHPGTGRRVEYASSYPADLAAALQLLDSSGG